MPFLDPLLLSFLAVADLQSFHRAADRLGISQPALSQRIARLEQTLGSKLFHRDARGVRLTAPGRVLAEVGKDLVSRAEAAQTAVRAAEEARANRLVLGYVEYGIFPFLPPALRRLREQAPQVEIVRRELYAELQIDALLRGEIDVGLGPAPEAKHDALCTVPLLEGEWTLVVPRSHALASYRRIPIHLLKEESLIIFQRSLNPPLFGRILAACDAAGFEPRIVFETAQAMVGPNLVDEGIGLFLVASYVLPRLPRTLVARPVDGLGGPLRIIALHRKGPKPPALRALLKALSESKVS